MSRAFNTYHLVIISGTADTEDNARCDVLVGYQTNMNGIITRMGIIPDDEFSNDIMIIGNDPRDGDYYLNKEFLVPIIEAALQNGQLSLGYGRDYAYDDACDQCLRHLIRVTYNAEEHAVDVSGVDHIHIGCRADGDRHVLLRQHDYAFVRIYVKPLGRYIPAMLTYRGDWEFDVDKVELPYTGIGIDIDDTAMVTLKCGLSDLIDDAIMNDRIDMIRGITDDEEYADELFNGFCDNLVNTTWLAAHHIVTVVVDDDEWDDILHTMQS